MIDQRVEIVYRPQWLRWLRHLRHRIKRDKAWRERSFKRRVEFRSKYAATPTSMAEARRILRRLVTCPRCGHTWESDGGRKCPACGAA